MKIRKVVLISLTVLGSLLILIMIAAGVIYYRSTDYAMPSLYAPELAEGIEAHNGDMTAFARSLVEQMTLEEKIDQMYGEKYGPGLTKMLIGFFGVGRFPHIYAGQNERLGIPPWVLSDGPRGARVLDKEINGVTTFPVGMARGASWDTELEFKINQVISAEMRANKVNYAATPCINLLRHPGWGRAQETYGEDPWHLGEFGVAAVKGIEHNDVMACPKHYALNSVENSRWVVDVQVDERSLREVYLPHFKKTVQEGKPASIMSAYNSVRGSFAGSNKELLTDILRDQWGFEGFVSTDWFYGLYDGIGGIKAGLDVEMPVQQAYEYDVIKKGIANGEISESDLDVMIERTLATRLKYALIDNQDQYPHNIIACQSHIDLAREAAEGSMVLVKNEGVLPFNKKGNKTVAVIGRLADVENTGDKGSSDSAAPYIVTPYEGIKKYHEALGNQVVVHDGADLEAATALATNADEVIVVVGFTFENEGEYIIMDRNEMIVSAEAGKVIGEKGLGGDREDLRLLPEDENLIKALAPSNSNLAVVYIGGSAIDMSGWEDNTPAILFAWYAGMEGGSALANILYGDANPSGKLPFTIAQDPTHYPYFTPYTMQITYDYYHGYTLLDKKGIDPAYPFGYGLSYSDFTYSDLSISNSEIGSDSTLVVNVSVTNESEIAGKEVAQLYVGFRNSEVDRPVKLLRGFEKVMIGPKETKTIQLEVDAKDLAWYSPESSAWEIEAMEYELYVGGSSSEADLLQDTFVIR